jgi:hypothetical protein
MVFRFPKANYIDSYYTSMELKNEYLMFHLKNLYLPKQEYLKKKILHVFDLLCRNVLFILNLPVPLVKTFCDFLRLNLIQLHLQNRFYRPTGNEEMIIKQELLSQYIKMLFTYLFSIKVNSLTSTRLHIYYTI